MMTLAPQLPPTSTLEGLSSLVEILSDAKAYKAKVDELTAHKKEIADKIEQLQQVTKQMERERALLQAERAALVAAKTEHENTLKTIAFKSAEADKRLSNVRAIARALEG